MHGHLERLDSTSGAVKFWDSPAGAKAYQYGVTITRDWMVWYSESGVQPNIIIRFDPKTETFCSRGDSLRRRRGARHGRHTGRPRVHCLQRGKQSRHCGDREVGLHLRSITASDRASDRGCDG